MTRENLPLFKYNPNAYNLGLFEEVKNHICPICNKITSHIYVGPLYSHKKIKGICPWCICNGEAAKVLKGSFQDGVEYKTGEYTSFYINDENKLISFNGNEEEEIILDKQLEELLFCTPSYNSWQGSIWLRHCDDFCEFIGCLEKAEITGMSDKLTEEIIELQDFYGLEISDSISFYLFKCIKCGKFRFHHDCT